MNCDCNDKCCELYNDIDEDDNQYFIDRLEDIIEICEFLIQVTKHKKMKKDTCDTILKDLTKENNIDKNDKSIEEEEEEEDKKDILTDKEKDVYGAMLRELIKQKSKRYPPYSHITYNHRIPFDWLVWY